MTLLKSKPTSDIKNILVIEDNESRIDWLASVVPYNVNVHWHTSVEDFISDYPNFVWDLIIFDHDLDPGNQYAFDDSNGLYVPESDNWIEILDKDKNGHDGFDAAKMLCKIENVDKSIPCFVWSANPDGSKNIKNELVSNGFKTVEAHRFDHFFLQVIKDKILGLCRC